MRKILILLSALLCISTAAVAQDATAIIDRYYKLTGMDKIDPIGMTAMIDMNMSANGMSITMSSAMRLPSKMKLEMDMAGQGFTVVINGDKGSLTLPGKPAQALPAAQMEQFRKQADILSSMKWNVDDYTITLLAPEEKDGKTYDAVKMVPKNDALPIKSQTLRFDRKTGLVDYATMIISIPQGGEVEMAVTYKDYVKTNSGFQYASKMETTGMGAVVSTHITRFELNCPLSDDLFEVAL